MDNFEQIPPTPATPIFDEVEWAYANEKSESSSYSEDSLRVVLFITLRFLKDDILEIAGGDEVIQRLQSWFDLSLAPDSEILLELQIIFQLLKMHPSPKNIIIDDLVAKVNVLMGSYASVETIYITFHQFMI